ncbi:MAG: hypothetical protein ACK5AZ_07280 [Bryobacteraceae bacterium]
MRGRIVRAAAAVPVEPLGPGPRGSRVQVVDYDATADRYYGPFVLAEDDPFADSDDEELLTNPGFHSQNVYAIVSRTLAQFEAALGRRVPWSFQSHQLQAAPHAFSEANAFYSRRDHALLFGYFPGRDGRRVFTSLSHDIVAHEATHAILDGLRERYMTPSSPDQAAFHEACSDIVAILAVFATPGVVRSLLGNGRASLPRSSVSVAALRRSALLGLAEEMGAELSAVRGALRRSASLTPSKRYLKEWLDPHTRGEVLVAAVLQAFLEVWTQRLRSLGEVRPGEISTERVVEEGETAARHLLTMTIRALDYTPPVDLLFGDYLSALLTADARVSPDDGKYNYRGILRESFAGYGIEPVSQPEGSGTWEPVEGSFRYDRIGFEHLQRDPTEAFRFLWDNREALKMYEDAFCRVMAVKPTLRVGPDGFLVRETLAEYYQVLDLRASDLRRLDIRKPATMPDDTVVTLYGGGVLLFNDYGQLAYHIRNRITNAERQSERLAYLWENGYFGRRPLRRFAELHRNRALQQTSGFQEGW